MNTTLQMKKVWILLAVLLFATLLGCATVNAMTPIPPDLVDSFKADGRYDDWLQQANKVKDYEISRNMSQGNEVTTLSEGTEAPPQRPLTNRKWFPTEGTANALVICVEFPDQLHYTSQTTTAMQNLMFGAENTQSSSYPYESVSAYYKRSSYNKLTITGEVWGWYMAQHNSSYYSSASNGNALLIEEALEYYKSQGKTFNQFDADNDGDIDALYIRFARRSSYVSGFWWAYMNYGDMDLYNIDGKKIYGYVFLPYDESLTGWTKAPRVAIHETGHLFGLPDLYDTDTSTGTKGGVGGCDIMDTNMGDHNAFSKYMLGWIEPTIISNGTQTVDLKPYATNPNALLIMPNASGNALEEYYMAQYITFEGNYSEYDDLYVLSDLVNQSGYAVRQYTTTGVVIWHVDAHPNEDSNFGFQYNNGYTSHKLIKLVEADGQNDIEDLPSTTWDGYKASSNDFFTVGKTFNDTTNPNSKKYDSTNTGMSVSFQSKTTSYMRTNVAYSSNSNAPRLLNAFYNRVTGKIHVKIDSAITSNANLNGITLTEKNTETTTGIDTAIGENELIITPSSTLKIGSRYILNIPSGAFKNSSNIDNFSAQFNIINESISKVVNGNYSVSDFIITARDNNGNTLNNRFLSSNATQVFGYVSLYNNTSQIKNIIGVLVLESEGKLKTLKSATYQVDPYSPLDATISYLPVDDMDLSRYKLILWEKDNIQPICGIYIFE